MTTSQDERMEAEINGLGLIHARVTNKEIDAAMATVRYDCHVVEGTTTTIAVAIISIGDTDFTLGIGKTACVDKRNFSGKLGVKYAIENASIAARDKLWELEGYYLARQLQALKEMRTEPNIDY